MRILYHHRTLGDGAEGIHISSIVNCMRDEGHDVKIVSLVGEDPQYKSSQKSKGSRWDYIRNLIPQQVYGLVEIAYNIAGYRILKKEIDNFKPDIIYDRYANVALQHYMLQRNMVYLLLLR